MKRILIACALLLLAVPAAQAHPCFEGAYVAPLPCPGLAVYEFGEAQFVGAGMWYGCVKVIYAGRLLSEGRYELRMFSDTEGTVSIREGVQITTAVGIVDLKARTVDYLGTVYKKTGP
jgi:hypothetical protein